MLERTRRKNSTQIAFVLPADQPLGQVSVVGDFNGWKPGAHRLNLREDGMRAVSVTMPTETRVRFRYLAQGDHWFDDQDADSHDDTGGYLHT